MAMNFPPWQQTASVGPLDIDFKYQDIPIGGKLLTAKLELTATDQMAFVSDDDYKRAIKVKVANQLAQVMIESNLIEFTKLPQIETGGDIIFARCYLAPNDQVKLLRLHFKT